MHIDIITDEPSKLRDDIFKINDLSSIKTHKTVILPGNYKRLAPIDIRFYEKIYLELMDSFPDKILRVKLCYVSGQQKLSDEEEATVLGMVGSMLITHFRESFDRLELYK